jgi:hypothetical protein
VTPWVRDFFENRARLAKLLFSLDAVLGIASIGGASLYGAAYSAGNVWVAFFTTFIPLGLLWALFCYGAYKGLASENVLLRILFWSFVVGHAIAFPVGTAIAGAAVWLWRERKVGR